jgi:hypothetical protein
MTVVPETAARNGAPPAAPVPPEGPTGAPTRWIVLGPRTRAALAAQLERSMGVVLLALLETSGVPDGQPYTLVLEGAHLEPASAPAPPAGP